MRPTGVESGFQTGEHSAETVRPIALPPRTWTMTVSLAFNVRGRNPTDCKMSQRIGNTIFFHKAIHLYNSFRYATHSLNMATVLQPRNFIHVLVE